MDLDAEADWDLSVIPLSGAIDISSSLQGEFLLIQEKSKDFLINRPFNARDVCRLALRTLNTLDEKHQHRSCVDGLPFDVQELVARVQWLECQVAAHSVGAASARGDMNRLEKSVALAARQLADAKLALLTVDDKHREYCDSAGIEMKQRGGLMLLLRGFCSGLVDHTSLVD